MKSPSQAVRKEGNHAECRGVLGRYALYGEIAHGGMATVHLGRLLGPVGFSRTVAIKRLHPPFAKDPDFVSMFLDEARLAARIRHPNVVPTLDVVASDGELFLVMEYVQGESLARIIRTVREKGETTPPAVAVAIMCGVLAGLHAAHEARTELGEPLSLVHRDMSPQNIMVCEDGIARVLDFGIAKASGRAQTTRDGQLKGKLSYIAPEQLRHDDIDRRTDIYAAGVTLWEMLVGHRLYKADNEWQTVHQILTGEPPAPSTHASRVPSALDAVVLKAMRKSPGDRFATARDMAVALEAAVPPASLRQVGEWIELHAGDTLRQRAARVAEVETSSAVQGVPSSRDGAAGASGERRFVSGFAPSRGEREADGAETLDRSGEVPSQGSMRVGVSSPSLRPSGMPSSPTGSSSSLLSGSLGSGSLGSGSREAPGGDLYTTASATLRPPPPPLFAGGASWAEPPLRPSQGRRLAVVVALGAACGLLVYVLWGRSSVEPSAALPSGAPTPTASAPTEVDGPSAASASVVGATSPSNVASAAVQEGSPARVEPNPGPAAGAPRGGAGATPAAVHAVPRSHGSNAHGGKAAAGGVTVAPTPAAPPAPPPGAAPSSAVDDCNPPFTLDSAGIRHPKPQCL